MMSYIRCDVCALHSMDTVNLFQEVHRGLASYSMTRMKFIE